MTDPSEQSSRDMGMIEAQGPYDPIDGDQLPGTFLPSPNDLFIMDQIGIYILELEFQISGPHKDTNQPGLELLRFPPMKIKVEKPVTAPFFAYSATNQGVYISIIGTRSNSLAGFDDGLQWRAFCENQHSVLESPDVSGFKMKLQDPDGKDVAPTALGRTIGVNFDAVQTSDRMPPGTKFARLDFSSGVYNIVPARPLPILKECFAMEKPGLYTLEVQMQLLRIKYDTTNGAAAPELLRFPPMSIKVNRP